MVNDQSGLCVPHAPCPSTVQAVAYLLSKHDNSHILLGTSPRLLHSISKNYRDCILLEEDEDPCLNTYITNSHFFWVPTLTCLILLYLFWQVYQFKKGHPMTAWMTHKSGCLSFLILQTTHSPFVVVRHPSRCDLTDFKARMSAQLPEGKAKASKG